MAGHNELTDAQITAALNRRRIAGLTEADMTNSKVGQEFRRLFHDELLAIHRSNEVEEQRRQQRLRHAGARR